MLKVFLISKFLGLMFIKTIEVENFRSFRSHQRIEASNRNVIIGKNGSGKSNLLAAIGFIFLLHEPSRPQYNNNEEISVIRVEIDNTDKRFPLPTVFSLRAVCKDGTEFFLNDKLVSKGELRGLLENAGLTNECFVMQGKVNDIAMMSSSQRFLLISRIAGVEKYEDSKAIAIKLLNEDNDEKVEALIERIEMKMKVTEEHKRKTEEYERLCKEKADVEFELTNCEIKELNEEIDRIVVKERHQSAESDEGLVDYEIKICRKEITRLALSIDEAKSFVGKFDKSFIDQIRAKLENGGSQETINPYLQKVLDLQKRRDDAYEALRALEQKETEKYIELRALRYFDALGSSVEDVSSLEQQLEAKNKEIENFQTQGTVEEPIRDLINQRKSLWIKEKQTKDEICKLKEIVKNYENKILYLGKQSINIFDNIKNERGIHGTVYTLFDVPDNIIDAYESVTYNSLFWIVVSDEDVATRLIEKIDGRTSFVALNRVKASCKPKIVDGSLIRLADQIKCDLKYRRLLEMVCKDYYVAPNIEDALILSEKYDINVVTLDGDVCNRNGSITGGYEKSNLVLRDLRNCKRKLSVLESSLSSISSDIKALNEKIKYREALFTEDDRILDNLKAVKKYLLMKIQFMKDKKISVLQLCDLEMVYNRILESIPQKRLELDSLESLMSRTIDKKEKVDEIIQKLQSLVLNQKRLEHLKLKERQLVDSMYTMKASDDLEADSEMQKKHMLVDRRASLMKKIGLVDFRQLYIKHTKEQLVSRLRIINQDLRNYYGFSRREVLDDKRAELKNRLEDLRSSKSKIFEFIDMLDQKKDDTMNLTFSMISDNYSYFYKQMVGEASSLALRNGVVDIVINGNVCDVPSMSGGQKTVIALCIIFAIQKNDPSPFYVFDEIDANLDKNYGERIYEIIGRSSSQHFITSFKEESVKAGSKFFGIAVANKESFVAEIDKELAIETIKA